MFGNLTNTEIFILGILGCAIVTLFTSVYPLALPLVAVAISIAVTSYKEIPTDPPTIALVTSWGERTSVLRKAGTIFLLSTIPIKDDIVTDTLVPDTIMFRFREVRCRARLPATDGRKRSGGAITVEGVLTYVPDSRDSDRFGEFIDQGKRQGIRSIVLGMLEEAIRHEGTKFDWETFVFAKARLGATLVTLLTDEKPRGATEQEIHDFLEEIFVGGLADVKGLGISISKLNITAMEPEGGLRAAAEQLAIEDQERSAEEVDTQTAASLAAIYVEQAKAAGEQLSFADALAMVRVDRGLSTEIQGRGRPTRTITDIDTHHGH